jgi:arylsulfatase
MRKFSFLLLGLLLVSVTAVLLIRPARVETANPPNVLLICIDTLRADHMPVYGYERETTPNIASFFSDGTVFEFAYASHTFTTQSVISILSGLIPQHHGVRYFYQIIPDELITIADTLGDSDYQTAAVVSNMVLTDEACGFASRFDHYDDFVDQKELYEDIYERTAGPTTDAALRWLTEIRDPKRPHFVYVHYMDPHGPYDPPEDKPVDYSHQRPLPIPVEAIPESQRHPGLTDAREYVDLYDEEIAYTDREVGRLLDAYAELGLAENSLIILTSDHGERLTEIRPQFDRPVSEEDRETEAAASGILSVLHGYYPRQFFKHGDGIEQEQARVPLLVRGRGFKKERIKTPVSLVDVVPTILESTGLEIPAGLDGVSLTRHPDDRLIFVEGFYWDRQCVIGGDRKWGVAMGDDGSVLRRWFCDLSSDPGEDGLEPWPEGEPATVVLMELVYSDPLRPTEESIEKVIEGQKLTAPKRRSIIAPGASEEDRERLRKIGYF